MRLHQPGAARSLLALLACAAFMPARAETPNGLRVGADPLAMSLDDMPWEKLGDKIYRKHAFGQNGNFGLFFLEAGAVIPEHRHPAEQTTFIQEGEVEITLGGQVRRVGAGGVIIIPADMPHSFKVLRDTLDLDFFSPARADWLNKSAAYFPASKNRAPEIVATLSDRPGNVAVAPSGRVFSTLHPLAASSRQLVEILPDGATRDFPSAAWQRPASEKAGAGRFDTPLGLVADMKNRLWTIDLGLGLGATRLFAFDLATGEKVFDLTLPDNIAPKGSFIQDLAVDERNGFVYLADIANPGLLVVNLADRSVRRISGHPSFQSEDVGIRIDGETVLLGGKPARVAVNPITLSADRETLHFGAMNGRAWYALPTKPLRRGAPDAEVFAAFRKLADKPVSAGAATDAAGNHYFGNLNENGVDVWKARTRTMEPLSRDPRLKWVDNVALSPDGHLYLSVNRLHRSAAFTGKPEAETGPYHILRVNLRD